MGAHVVPQREELIDQIDDVTVLRERLKAAERVCILDAWDAAPNTKTAVGRLQMDTWSEWYRVAGGMTASDVRSNTAMRDALRDAERRDRTKGGPF